MATIIRRLCLSFVSHWMPVKSHPESMKLLANRIKRRRGKLGISQEELAFNAGIDRSYMGGIERGQRNPSFQHLCMIASALRVDLGSLLRGIPERD